MKVKDLIVELQKFDPDLTVFGWVDGDRYPVSLAESMGDCVDLNISCPQQNFFNDVFPYALGYWQGRACGHFENGTYENMSDRHQHLYRMGYDSGVTDYCETDEQLIKEAE